MRTAVIAILLAIYIAMPNEWLAMDTAPYICRALAYPFFHANLFHLAVNCFALWNIYSPRMKPQWKDVMTAFIISFLVYPLTWKPVIGISNILYAQIGMQTPELSDKWWRSSGTITFFAVTILMAVIPNIAATTHIASFILGAGVAAVRRYIVSLDNDIEGIH